MKLVKFVTLGLSAAIFMCLLFFLTRFFIKSDTRDVPEMVVESRERLCLCGPAPSSKSDMLTTTSTKYGTDNTISTERGTPTSSSAMSSSVKLTPLPTQSPIAPPSIILYLMQTEQCIPPYYKKMDVFGGENQGFEVIVLSYREACLEAPAAHLHYILNNNTTWTTGRNLLFETAMERNKTYLYYVFMDDDITLEDPRRLPIGPWRRFENSLRSYEPAIAAIDPYLVPFIRNFHVDNQCSGETAEFIGTVWFDAILNAFHYKSIRHILPYDPAFDEQTWWASQMSVIIRSEILFRGQAVLHSNLLSENGQHRPYPRDLDFTPQMINHMTKNVAAILNEYAPTKSVVCANATVQRWRTASSIHQYRFSSPTLCLPPPHYHDTIVPGRYACA